MLAFPGGRGKLGSGMNENAQRIKEYLSGCYPETDWPTLLYQAEEWSSTRPLEGLRILDATPLYRNTLAKFMPLLAAGAQLFVPAKYRIPFDPAIYAMLPELGIRYATKEDTESLDIVLDCAGQCTRLTPSLGYCELTRSGASRYERTRRPVFMVDDSRIKRIETMLGTGDSFFRALKQLGYGEVASRRLLVVGYGKVGRGIVHYACKYGMKVTVADIVDKSGEVPGDVSFVPINDMEAFNDAVLHAWCMVTVTGRISALRHQLHAAAVIDSPVLLANMGVEDEFGSQIPENRVLNHKHPLNFILEEPTSMRYIETTMALHNACGLDLLTQDLPPHCISPCPDVEERLLAVALERGSIADDYPLVECLYNNSVR